MPWFKLCGCTSLVPGQCLWKQAIHALPGQKEITERIWCSLAIHKGLDIKMIQGEKMRFENSIVDKFLFVPPVGVSMELSNEWELIQRESAVGRGAGGVYCFSLELDGS